MCSVRIQSLLLPIPLLQAELTQWQEMALPACFASVFERAREGLTDAGFSS